MAHYRRFEDASVSEKLLDSMFLITIGIGYIFALTNLYYTHQGRDNQPGLSVKDVMIAYYGAHNQTRLGAAVNGPMAVNFKTDVDKRAVLDWIHKGANEDDFKDEVQPIFDKSCIACHSKASGLPVPPLTSFEEVVKLTETDTGTPLPALVRVSHIHLFGIAFILFFVGQIFILCQINILLKRILVTIPFIFLLIDISAWYITKLVPGFAYVVVIAGGLMGLSFGAQLLVSLYQMWIAKQGRVA